MTIDAAVVWLFSENEHLRAALREVLRRSGIECRELTLEQLSTSEAPAPAEVQRVVIAYGYDSEPALALTAALRERYPDSMLLAIDHPYPEPDALTLSTPFGPSQLVQALASLAPSRARQSSADAQVDSTTA